MTLWPEGRIADKECSRRRAKIKMMAKKGIEHMDDIDHIPESMRQLLAMQAMQEGKPFPAHLMGRPGAPMSCGTGFMPMGTDINNSGKVGE